MIGGPGGGEAKGTEPALAHLFTAAKASERCEVTVRKRHIELFHSWPVFKQAGGDAFFDLERDISVERGKKAETIPLVARAQNNLIEFRQNFIDGLC